MIHRSTICAMTQTSYEYESPCLGYRIVPSEKEKLLGVNFMLKTPLVYGSK